MRVPLLGEERLDQGLHLAPRDLRCHRLDVLRDVRGGLADDDESEANGLDGLLVAREIRFLEVGRVAPDPLYRGEDIGDT